MGKIEWVVISANDTMQYQLIIMYVCPTIHYNKPPGHFCVTSYLHQLELFYSGLRSFMTC